MKDWRELQKLTEIHGYSTKEKREIHTRLNTISPHNMGFVNMNTVLYTKYNITGSKYCIY
jgi:hypothetical protein